MAVGLRMLAEPGGYDRPIALGGGPTALAGNNIVTLTDATFNETIHGSTEPVLVDFWAEWCGPCKLITPVLEELATDYAGRLRVAKLNVDDSIATARQYEVMSIPTLIIFQDGEPKRRLIGAKGKGQLLEELRTFL